MFTQLTAETYRDTLGNADNSVVIFFKKLCPHCKNMEKVLEKFAAQRPEVTFFSIDTEELPQAMQDFGVERPPTILVIKQGKAAAFKAGLMNPREMAALYDQAK